MSRYWNVRQVPVSEMSAAQLARYHRALVSSLKRCREEWPRYQEMRTCLGDVLAEERARRLAGRASTNMLLVPPYPQGDEPAGTWADQTSR